MELSKELVTKKQETTFKTMLQWRKTKYPELMYNHFSYQDAVDSHNSSRMVPIAMEETWKTTRWPLRVFFFLMAVSEVICWLVLTNIYKQPERSQQDFRKEL